jgi:hypothetical protein
MTKEHGVQIAPVLVLVHVPQSIVSGHVHVHARVRVHENVIVETMDVIVVDLERQRDISGRNTSVEMDDQGLVHHVITIMIDMNVVVNLLFRLHIIVEIYIIHLHCLCTSFICVWNYEPVLLQKHVCITWRKW